MEKINDLIYRLGMGNLSYFCHYDFKLIGEKPAENVLFASTHYGSFDAVLLALGLERGLVAFSGKKGRFFKPPHLIPNIGRIVLNGSPTACLEKAEYYLKRDYSLAMFSEGAKTSFKEGEIGEVYPGIFWFSDKLNLPIIPVAMRGAQDIWPRETNAPFPAREGRVIINLGQTLNTEGKTKKDLCALLRNEIVQLYQEALEV